MKQDHTETFTEKLMRAATEAWHQWPWVPGGVVREMTGSGGGDRTITQLAVALGCDEGLSKRWERSLYAVTKAVFEHAPRVCDTCNFGFIGCAFSIRDDGFGCEKWEAAIPPWQDVLGARRRWAEEGSEPVRLSPGELLDRARVWQSESLQKSGGGRREGGAKMLNIVKLRTGEEELAALVVGTMKTLRALGEEDPMTLLDLYHWCADGGDWLLPTSVEPLYSAGLIMTADSKPDVHPSIRAIVKSAVVVNGADVVLRNPVAP